MQHPRLDRSKPDTIGRISPPHPVGDGRAVYEQNHHYFDTHGRYLGSHEGYEPGADTGAAADKIISEMREMSEEAKAKIMRELGLAPAEKPKRGKKAAAAEEIEEAEEIEGDAGQPQASGLTQPRGPLGGGGDDGIQRFGGLDLIAWARKEKAYSFGQVSKAFHETWPDRPYGDTKAVLDGMVAEGIISREEIKRG